jgi:enolase
LILAALYFGYVSFLQDDYPLPKIDDDILDQWNEWVEPYRSIDLNVTLFGDDQVPDVNINDTPRE